MPLSLVQESLETYCSRYLISGSLIDIRVTPHRLLLWTRPPSLLSQDLVALPVGVKSMAWILDESAIYVDCTLCWDGRVNHRPPWYARLDYLLQGQRRRQVSSYSVLPISNFLRFARPKENLHRRKSLQNLSVFLWSASCQSTFPIHVLMPILWLGM